MALKLCYQVILNYSPLIVGANFVAFFDISIFFVRLMEWFSGVEGYASYKLLVCLRV